MRSVAPPSFTVTDGAHGGNPHFFWLPPMVASPSTTGMFDPEVSPQVDICQWNSSACVLPMLATYTMTTGPGSETVRVDTTNSLYIVNWHTDQFPLVAGATYRITASVLGTVIGTADVAILSTGSAKNVSTGDDIPLLDGKTLPIKFRIEQGMVVSVAVTPNPDTVIVGKARAVTATLTDAHGSVVTGQPITWTSATPAVATVDATGAVTGAAVGIDSITASSNGMSGSGLVVVIPPPVASVSVTPAASTAQIGATEQLTATLKDADGNVLIGRVVTWASSDPSTATIDGDGVVTAVKAGIVTITATSEGVSGEAQVTIAPSGFVLASVSVGDRHVCGLTADGTAYCWGANDFSQLGIGDRGGSAPLPTLVSGGLKFAEIEVGSITTCARTADGTAYCWGANGNGGVGDGTTIERSVPTAVATSLKFLRLTDHGGAHCGLATDGTAWCWGRSYGSLPYQISSTLIYRDIQGGGINDCGLGSDGVPHCWGEQFGGPYPFAVGLNNTYSSITVGLSTACGLDASGYAWCWGSNTYGDFGNGTTTATDGWAQTAVAGAAGMQLVSLRAGEFGMCGLAADGSAYCWGDNTSGRIGDGTTTQRLTPTAVATQLRFTKLSTGQFYTNCGLTSDGAVYCWGGNSDGEIGDGTYTDRFTPVRVLPPSGD